MERNRKILVVEDDRGLRSGISFSLTQEGYQVLEAENGGKGWKLFQEENPDGMILDLNLPDMDGNQLCRRIREKSWMPVLMLTARDLETDEIMGLSNGADDYMTKPFSLAVLKLRLKKLLDRGMDGEREMVLSSGSVQLNLSLMKAYKEEKELDCSMTEFKLLKCFLENKGRVLTQNQLLDLVWDCQGKYVNQNTLQVNIGRLRKKLETGEQSFRQIKTIHGIGYLWEEEP